MLIAIGVVDAREGIICEFSFKNRVAEPEKEEVSVKTGVRIIF